jgi:FecR-like protein
MGRMWRAFLVIGLVGAATAAANAAPAAATETGPPFLVEFDSHAEANTAFLHYQYHYTDKIPIDASSGHYFGQNQAVFESATGGGQTPAGECGTAVETLTGTKAQPIAVDAFDGFASPGESPSIAIHVTPPSETYHDQTGCGSAESERTFWNAAFSGTHLGQVDRTNGNYVFPLQSREGPVIAENTFSGTAPGGFSDSTTIKVISTTPCGKKEQAGTVTFSEGEAPPVGQPVCEGDMIKTGANGRAEVTLKDGSIVRIGPNSEAQVNGATEGQGQKITLHLILGIVWGKVTGVLGGGNEVEVETYTATTGVRGRRFLSSLRSQGVRLIAPASSSFTAHAGAGGKALFHAISGKLRTSAGGKTITADAGHGVEVTAKGATPTDRWPTSDRSLVPADEQPPAIAGLKVTSRKRTGKAGGDSVVALKLDGPATLKIAVRKGKKVVARQSAKGRKGADAIKLKKRIRPGRYLLQVEAADAAGRVAVASGRFQVKR